MGSARPQVKPVNDRVARRRRQLAELTLRLARERGFNAFSVNELAVEAKMSVGGLYRYIKTKSDLLVLVCDEINRGLPSRMAEAAAKAKGITAKLTAAYSIYWETCWAAALPILLAIREWQSLPKEAKNRYLNQERQTAGFFSDLIRAGVASEEFSAVDSALLADHMIMLAQMKAVKGWVFEGYERSVVFGDHLGLILARLDVVNATEADRGDLTAQRAPMKVVAERPLATTELRKGRRRPR